MMLLSRLQCFWNFCKLFAKKRTFLRLQNDCKEIINVLEDVQSELEEVFDVLDNIFCDLANLFVDKLYRSNEFPKGKKYINLAKLFYLHFTSFLLTTLFILRFSLSDKRVASSKLNIFVRDLHNSSTTTSGKNFLITC